MATSPGTHKTPEIVRNKFVSHRHFYSFAGDERNFCIRIIRAFGGGIHTLTPYIFYKQTNLYIDLFISLGEDGNFTLKVARNDIVRRQQCGLNNFRH